MNVKKFLFPQNITAENLHKTKIDHSITFIMIVFIIVLFSSIQIFAQEKVKNKKTKKADKTLVPYSTQAGNNKIEFKNSVGNAIITITDEGHDAGSITLPLSTPTTTNYKLYNEGGILKFNGSAIGSGGGADSINQLVDAKYDGSSLFLGSGAGANNDGTSNYNTAIGLNSLYSNTTGRFNTANGSSALYYNTTGALNTANGFQALLSNTTGSNNTANGYRALYSNTTGYSNTANGYHALYYNTTGNNNTASGYFSLNSNTTGSNNTANGRYALRANTTGSKNTAIGYGALDNNTIGNFNVGVGFLANLNNQEGSNNTIIGYEAGKGTAIHNKSGNVFIGYQAGFDETNDNRLYIENSNSSVPLIWGDFANDIAAINGKFGIGTQSPSDRLHISALASEDAFRLQIGGNTKLRVFSNGGTSIGTNNSSGTPTDGLYVHGNVGLGVSNPTAKLEVNGKVKSTNFQMTNGAANGYVLTSDASGNANWQANSSGSDNDWTINGVNIYSSNSGNVGIGSSNPTAKLHVLSTKGVLFSGYHGNGSIPATGVGTRMMWYPKKAAFRSGYVTGTHWDDANIGDYSTSMGHNSIASGNASIAVGRDCEASGSFSTAFGIGAQASGDKSVALGVGTAIGLQSVSLGQGSANGDYSFATGISIANGIYSTALGYITQADGQSSTSMGHYTKATGDYSTALGYFSEASGNTSTALGRSAKVSGEYSVAISLGTTLSNVTNNNTMAITGGNVGIGINSPLYTLHVDGTAAKTSGTAWINVSDRRLKDVLGKYEKGLNEIEKLRTVKFKYKEGNQLNLPSENIEYGFIAQEVQKIFPEAIGIMDNGYLDFNFHPIHVAMVNAVQELSEQKNDFEKRIKELEMQNTDIRNQNLEALIKNKELEERLAKLESLLDGKRFTKVSN